MCVCMYTHKRMYVCINMYACMFRISDLEIFKLGSKIFDKLSNVCFMPRRRMACVNSLRFEPSTSPQNILQQNTIYVPCRSDVDV